MDNAIKYFKEKDFIKNIDLFSLKCKTYILFILLKISYEKGISLCHDSITIITRPTMP
jgi:hypothetical protein